MSFAEHPLTLLPVTIYSVETTGDATGFAIAVADKPVAGDHT